MFNTLDFCYRQLLSYYVQLELIGLHIFDFCPASNRNNVNCIT